MPKVTPKHQVEAQALHFTEDYTIPAGHWLLVYPDDTYALMSEARLREHYDLHRPSGERIGVAAPRPTRLSSRPKEAQRKIRRGAIWVRIGEATYKVQAQQARILHAMHRLAPDSTPLLTTYVIREPLTGLDRSNIHSRLRDMVIAGYCEQGDDNTYRLTDLGRTMAVAAIDKARSFLVPDKE